MTTVRHYPETLPEPTETAFPGYPIGVWPPIISSFCNEDATWQVRHGDCSMPACSCPCHSRPRWGKSCCKLSKSSRGISEAGHKQSSNPRRRGFRAM